MRCARTAIGSFILPPPLSEKLRALDENRRYLVRDYLCALKGVTGVAGPSICGGQNPGNPACDAPRNGYRFGRFFDTLAHLCLSCREGIC